MNIVGVNISHDTSVCLMQDGKIIFYLEEERLCRIKHYVITEASPKNVKTLNKIKNFIKEIDYLIITTLRRNVHLRDVQIAENVVNQLIEIGLKVNKVILSLEDHHLFHAHNSFYLSGVESAVAIVADGSGSYSNLFPNENGPPYREIESIYEFNNNQYKMLFKHCSSFNIMGGDKFFYKTIEDNKIVLSNTLGCGQLFRDVSINMLKLSELEAGKTMGISSYGVLNNNKTEWFNKYEDNFFFDYDFFGLLLQSKMHETASRNKIYGSTSFQEQANFAKKLQHETKEYTIRLIQKAINLTDAKNVVLSGGYFQNCVNNYAYLKAFPNINFYVDPICYDGGTAIGACFYVWYNILGNPNTLQKFDNLYLGPR